MQNLFIYQQIYFQNIVLNTIKSNILPIVSEQVINESNIVELSGIEQLKFITVLEIKTSEIILIQFKSLKFSNMILKFMKQLDEKDKENVLDFNPYKSLINLQLSNLELQSNDIATNIKIHSCDNLIINEVQIQEPQTKYRYTFENIKNFIISNLNIKNIKIQTNQEFFSFKNIQSIEIRNIDIIESQFDQKFMYFYNVSSVKMINTDIQNSLFKKEIISVELVENFSLEHTYVNLKSIDGQQINSKQDFFYLLKFKSVQNVSIYNSTLSNLYQLGFISFLGNMINFEKTNTFSIRQSQLTNLKTSQPFIILQIAKILTLATLNVTNVECSKITNFINLNLISQVDLRDINMSQFNTNLQQNRILEIQSQNTQQNSFLLSLQGISNSILKNALFIQCNQTGIIRITSSDEQEGIVQISKQVDILNLKLVNSEIDILDQPLFKFQIKQANLIELNITDIKSQHHIIDTTNSFQIFTISKSLFKDITFKNSSTTLIAQNSGTLVLNQTNFESITSYNSSSSLILNEIENITIHKSKFTNLKNKQFIDDKSQRKSYDGNINIQQCLYQLKITESDFKDNESYFNGGVFYLNTIKDVTIISSNFFNNFVETQSGGAIYLAESKVDIKLSYFIENKSKQEKGGALFSINKSLIKLKNTQIMNNEAIIGGGIYHDNTSQLEIDKTNTFSGNKGNQQFFQMFISLNYLILIVGYFYGKNQGSYPKSIKKFDLKTNQASELIEVFSFQSGNFIKQDVYVQFFDEEDQILNFLFNDEGNMKVSDQILDEQKLCEIELKNSYGSELVISSGQQLKLDEEFKNYFKLNIKASYKNQKNFELELFSTLQNIEVKQLKLKLNFRECIFGEIATYKSGFIECNECPINTYSLNDPFDNSTLCQKCPIEAENCQANNITLKDGYWRESKMVDKIYSCPLRGCSEQNGNEHGCLQGYIGPACSACDYNGQENMQKYGPQGVNCYQCSRLKNIYIYLAVTLLFYIIYIHYSLRSQVQFKQNIIKLYYLRKIEILYLSKTIQNGADTSVLIKILLHYIQIVSLSLDFYSNIPFSVDIMISIFGDPIKVTYNSYDCLFAQSLIPYLWINRYLTLLGQIFIISCVILLIQKHINQKNLKFYRIRIYAIFIYFFFYSSHTKLLIQLCICREYGQKSYLLNDFLQECWTTEHIILSVLIIYPLTIIWVFLIPLKMIRKIRNAIQQNKSQSIDYILSYYFIQQGYKHQYYFWEIVRMIQKFTIMVSLSSSFQNHQQRLMVILICFFYLQVLKTKRPLSSQPLMELEIILTQIIVFSLILQAMIDYQNLSNSLNFIIVFLIILVNTYGILMLFKQYLFLQKKLLKKLSDTSLKTVLLQIKYFKEIHQRQKVSLLRVSQLWKLLKNITFSKIQRTKYSPHAYITTQRTDQIQSNFSEIKNRVVKLNEQNINSNNNDFEQEQLEEFTCFSSPTSSRGFPVIKFNDSVIHNKNEIRK